MSEENLQTTPELTLDATPELTLDTTPAAPEVPMAKPAAQPESLEDRAQLTEVEKKQVEQFSQQINIKDSGMILQYGSGAQKKMTTFSEGALNSVKSKDLGEVGDMLTGLVTELKSFSTEETEKGGFFSRLGKKASNKITAMKAKYDTVEKNVDNIATTLEGHQVTLMKDIAMLDKMYDQNVVYFKELTMYILAGKKSLAAAKATDLPALQEKAKASGLPEDAQASNDFANLIDRFEKKIYDLELTRTISIQMAPQIRLIQNNDTLMSEKIQSTIVNTIPLWKSQMVLALGLAHSQQAAKAQREVTDMTNDLLKKNSEALKTATIETARESERGIVDIETLQQTNQNLISTLDEVVQIQADGRQKRAEAEVELGRIEGELKQKLLEMRD